MSTHIDKPGELDQFRQDPRLTNITVSFETFAENGSQSALMLKLLTCVAASLVRKPIHLQYDY